MPSIAPHATTDRRAGDEPIPGYVLVEPLGRGGFGEVWKCVAPGGLHKAVKFVPVGGDQFRQEAAAFERVRAIRHAFLLTLERVEPVGGHLVMVMELADAQLQDRVDECRRGGLPGIPRDELLPYLLDAAEALDVIAAKYGLQHLDVKPANLFLIDGHVKVGDYGLVRGLGPDQSAAGLTPKFAAPEVLRGHADARSDQYSLALVYYELLTGAFPFPGPTAQQLMLQHVTAAPDLSALPAADRPTVARALSKQPADRFPSCTAFVRTLAGLPADAPRSGIRSYPVPALAGDAPPETVPTAGGTVVVPATALSDTARHTALTPRPPAVVPADPALAGLPPVAWVPRLRPRPARAGELAAAEFVRAVVDTVRPDEEPAAVPNGTRVSRFLCTVPVDHVPQKLADVGRRFGLTVSPMEPGEVVLYRTVTGPTRGGSRGEGVLWVSVRRAEGGPETVAAAGLDGDPGDAARRDALRALPGLLAAVRGALENMPERRTHPRYAAGFPVRMHLVNPDGTIGAAEDGVCEDVSAGGVRILTRGPVPADRMYLEFRSIEGVAGNAVLAVVTRAGRAPGGHATACRFPA